MKFIYCRRAFCMLAILPTIVYAQNKMTLSLQEALNIAREKSLLSKNIQANYKSTQYQYKSFMSSLKPQISVSGYLPTYDQRLDNVIQPDGSYKVQAFRRSSISTNVYVEQNIFWTGGTAFVTTNLNQFVNRNPNYQKQYQVTPFAIGIRQPLSLFNVVKWNYEQQKLRMKQATKRQVEEFEDLSLQITETYFDLYVAKMQLENAKQNEATNDTLYKISTGRFNVGKIAENELLQVELQLMNAKNAVTQSEVSIGVSTKRLKNLLGIENVNEFELIPITNAPIFIVNTTQAVSEAKANRSDLIEFDLQENNAKRELRQSQSNRFASGEVIVSYGQNQTAPTLADAYKNPLNSQQINVGYSIPLFGFGKSKYNVQSSRENLEAVQAQVKYRRQNFEIDIENSVNQFNQLQAALLIAAKSDTIAQKRFEVAKNRYLLGKISITDLGLAQDAKDRALIDYIRTLQQYWVSYYRLRRVTLFDFENNVKIAY